MREPVGSGPYRLGLSGYPPDATTTYRRFDGYASRANGRPTSTSGLKVAHVDTVVWQVIPDAQTAQGALTAGEVDWWERPAPDLLPLLRRDAGVTVALTEREGQIPVMRLNCLQPPFSNPAVRRVALRAIGQKDVMPAVAGDDASLWRDGFGVFPPGTPYSNDAGMAELAQRPSDAALKQTLAEAGYRGERTVLLVGMDSPIYSAAGQVVADTLKQAGINIDVRAVDTATMLQRRVSKAPVDGGGWSAFFVTPRGWTCSTPPAPTLSAAMARGPGMVGPQARRWSACTMRGSRLRTTLPASSWRGACKLRCGRMSPSSRWAKCCCPRRSGGPLRTWSTAFPSFTASGVSNSAQPTWSDGLSSAQTGGT